MRLEAYEHWRIPTKVDFKSILGVDAWEDYWSECESVLDEMHRCQQIADSLRKKIIKQLGGNHK